MNYRIKGLEMLMKMYCRNNIITEQKEYVGDVLACTLNFIDNDVCDINNFNDFIEGCREALDNIIGEKDVEDGITLATLYVKHFGQMQADEYQNGLKSIYEKIISSWIMEILYIIESKE